VVAGSNCIPRNQSKDLINRLCGQGNQFFKSAVGHAFAENSPVKTENQNLFLNIETVNRAIKGEWQVRYTLNNYGADKSLHKACEEVASPYQMFLHNQRYYLMAYSENTGDIVYRKMDRITDMKLMKKASVPLDSLPGYRNGLDMEHIRAARPYLCSDKTERVIFLTDEETVDDVIEWFGKDVRILKQGDRYRVSLVASPRAMEYWALQYVTHVEILEPASLREKVQTALRKGMEKYCA